MAIRDNRQACSIALAAIVAATVPPLAARASTPYVDLTQLSQTTLEYSMSLAGFDFSGDDINPGNAIPGQGAALGPADFGIGPLGGLYPDYWYSSNGSQSPGLPGFVGDGAVFWLEPGSSMSDLADARFAVFVVADGHNFTTPFYSDVSLADGAPLPFDDELDGACFGGAEGRVVLCPILSAGQSIDIPIAIEIPIDVAPGSYVEYTTLHLSFTDAAVVPEPAAWALMLVGFGALGIALRGPRRPGGRRKPTVGELTVATS